MVSLELGSPCLTLWLVDDASATHPEAGWLGLVVRIFSLALRQLTRPVSDCPPRQSRASRIPDMPHVMLPRSRSSAGAQMAWHSVLFRIWMADDTVIAPSLLMDRNTYSTFGDLSGIVRFHAYAGGHEAGVYQLLRIFALPPTAITLADQMWTAVRGIRDLHARAFLIALLGNIRTATPHGMG